METAADALDLGAFVSRLAGEGLAVVSGASLEPDSANAIPALRELDERARTELGRPAPAFSAGVAVWAARLVYHVSQFMVCREVAADRVSAACQSACPEPRGPDTDWSADLTLRHLPRLFHLARQLSTGDPLVQHLRHLAAAWPLSSVGIPGLGNVLLDTFVAHPALARLYADRILAAADTSRLGDPRIDDLLRADLGIHHDLAPAIAARFVPLIYDTR